MTSKVIAVTGGIGSGKSETIRYLQSLGYDTLDCDVLAREVSNRPQVIDRVSKLLGDGFVVDGQLNRSAIRNVVFANENLLSQYNALFFDEVQKLLKQQISVLADKSKANNRDSCIVFVEISVFDAFEYPWDEVWLVEADVDIRLDRAQKRDNVSRQSLDNIAMRQRICNSYTRKLVNNGDLKSLKAQIDMILTKFMSI